MANDFYLALSGCAIHAGMVESIESVLPPDADASVPVTYHFANCLNGRRAIRWKVEQSWGSNQVVFQLKLDTTHPDYPPVINGVGITNHSFLGADVDRFIFQYSLIGGGFENFTNAGTWHHLSNELYSGGDFDTIFRLGADFGQAGPYFRFFFDFEAGTIQGDFELGELFLGDIVDFQRNPAAPVSRELVVPSGARRLEGVGGRVATVRGNPEERFRFGYPAVATADIDDFREMAGHVRGAARPFLLHTHYHTGLEDYKTDGTYDESAIATAGAYFMQRERETAPFAEFDEIGLHSVDLSLIRSLAEKDLPR